ncbi:MAG: YWFCY domain-containing protein [Sphingobacterium sp.]|jgi:TusA-related sulfurtransferase|nr:YWFCY domain-containing protein [Sphingobacterium sp.]
MNTGEDIQGLRKIVDFTRLLSIFILAIHFYLACYPAFVAWGFTADITDRVVQNIVKTGLFADYLRPKLGTLLLLVTFLVGIKGKKDEKISRKKIAVYLILGLILYFTSTGILYMRLDAEPKAIFYITVVSIGYLLMLTGGTWLSRLLKNMLNNDIFNEENETFPQEERLLENEYSVNLPAKYRLKKEIRNSWINFINMFRGLLVIGTPGSGKSYFVVRHIIDQHIKKGFSMFVYDFKFDDLTKIAYNKLLQYQGNYAVPPTFYIINFDDMNRTHRCNPLDPTSMEDITDAIEASRTIMLGLNRSWIKSQGEFFTESPINFLTAIIWYLRKYEGGRFCTLPHVIELMQTEYDPLFAILDREEEIKVLVNPFISAFKNKAMEQLEGQIASAKIALARLASPQLYYVLNGNDFTLDINNPQDPKIVAMGNNPLKIQIYGAVLSLYINRMIKLVNRKKQLKSSLIFDEFPTVFVGGSSGIDGLLATARSNFVATTLAVQNYEQLKKDYGDEQANVITNIVGNVISGQVMGNTAKSVSELFGKIQQEKMSQNIGGSETSFTKSTQMDLAIPSAKIAQLSSGEFVGIVADNPEAKIKLKMFHCEIQNDHKAIAEEERQYKEIPEIATVTNQEIQDNYELIKNEVRHIVRSELNAIRTELEAIQPHGEAGQEEQKPPTSM